MIDLLYLYIFILAAFVGYEVISRVPVKASSASGQGREAPISNIAFIRSPTCRLP